MASQDDVIPQVTDPFKSILIFGPPGSGKGTMGKFLGSASNHYHLSSGDIFRGLSPESPAGKLYHKYASKGYLLPDDVTVKIWHHYVLGLIATNQYFPSQQYLLLDGIPRTVKQAEFLDSFLKIEHIIVLDIQDPKVLIQRLKRRALIEKRTDDTDEEVLKRRFEIYQNETQNVLKHYPKELISTFNGSQKPLAVLRDILIQFSDIM